MSCLTTDTKIAYVAALYDRENRFVADGNEYSIEESAVAEGEELVRDYVDMFGKYCFARIEKRVVPLYE